MLLQPIHRFFRVQWLLLDYLLLLMIYQASCYVQAQNLSSFDFPTFNSTDKLLLNLDAQYMLNSSSIWLQPSYNGSSNGRKFSCGAVIYADAIQMRDSSNTSPAVASFNTSFTFSMTGKNSAGMAFMFSVDNHTTLDAGASLCLLPKPRNGNPNNHVFAVEFDTWQNPEFKDPSNNHVGVNINSMNSTSVHNLCETSASCDYLVTDQDFTSWIDYDITTQTVEVFFTKGSTIQGISKPADPIIRVPHLDLTNVFHDYMFVGISGSGAMYPEIKKIKSWSFKTRSFGGGTIPVVQSNLEEGSKSRSWVGLIAGIISAVCVLSIALVCVSYFVGCRGVKSEAGDGEEALSTEF